MKTEVKTSTRSLPADIVVIWAGRETYGQRGIVIGPGSFAGMHRVYHSPSGRVLELHPCEFERRPQPTAGAVFLQ